MSGGKVVRATALVAVVAALSGVARADQPPFDFGYACTSTRQHAWYQDWSCVDSPLATTGILAGYVMDDSHPRSGIVYCPYECPIPETPRGVAVQSVAGILHEAPAGTTIYAAAQLVGWGCLVVHHHDLAFPLWTPRTDLTYGQVCGQGNLDLTSRVLEHQTLPRVSVVGDAIVLDITAQTVTPSD
jgi:hypothetical protein